MVDPDLGSWDEVLDQWFGRYLRLLGAILAIGLWLLTAELLLLVWVR